MCGIIGYTGGRQAAPILIEGLTNLEYRGYDSTGIAINDVAGSPKIHKSSGKLSKLKSSLGGNLPEGFTGLGHTRWATHGRPTNDNAHPHSSCKNEVTIVHNGIVENHTELKRELMGQGHNFLSQTDSECIPHLIESYLSMNYSFENAVRETALRLHGSNAVVAISNKAPGHLVGVRLGNAGGIVVGYGDNEMLLASDVSALLPHTRRVVYLESGEMVSMDSSEPTYTLLDSGTSNTTKTPATITYNSDSIAKGEYDHFMLKEIYEQPRLIIDSLSGRASFDDFSVQFEELPFTDQEIQDFNRVVVLGMGTSLHAAMVGRNWFESLARIPTEADNSSEFRYRNPVIDEKTLVISISQSGETADTLAAMEEATRKKTTQITLCNYAGTQTERIADATILIRAGVEIGVASSKTFTCSLTSLYLLALYIGAKRRTISNDRLKYELQGLAKIPDMMGKLLTNKDQYGVLAEKYASYSNFLYLGRGRNFPLAMEGALKLKEISYIHAEGYQAGEMKHGPISLIDPTLPIVALAPKDELYEKMLNNINEAKARQGIVVAIATENDSAIEEKVDDVIYIPTGSTTLTPLLMAIPMQLLAYSMAVRKGCDVDQPRNLAKSVTVE